jgi:hypothetical protein
MLYLCFDILKHYIFQLNTCKTFNWLFEYRFLITLFSVCMRCQKLVPTCIKLDAKSSNIDTNSSFLLKKMNSSSDVTNLPSKWSLFYHLPQNKCWDLASYINVFDDIDTLEKLIAV